MLTAEQFAAKIGTNSARVRRLCIDGRVKGATKFGHAWMIPTDARVEKVPMGRPKKKRLR